MTKYANQQISNFLDTWLQQRTDQDGLPGFVVAIRQKGKTIYKRTFQATDIATPIHTSIIFNIGSQAKLLTATLILQAVERKELTLDALVVQFIPWLADHTDQRVKLITVEQLLWHGAGLLRDGLDADYWQLTRPFPDNTALRQLVLSAPLTIRSGYKLKYSNLGYALLGEILKTVTGMEYEVLIKKYIAAPLKLESFTTHLSSRVKTRIAPGYTERIDGTYRTLTTVINTNAFTSVVGCYTTAEDMTKVIDEIINGTILLGSNVQRMLISGGRAHWIPENQRGSQYGLGVMSLGLAGQTLMGHSGALLAHRSATYTDPSTNTTIAVMATSKQVPVNQILTGIFEALNYLTPELSAAPTPNNRFTASLQNLLGAQYIIGLQNKVIKISLDDWYPFDQIDEMEVIDDTTLKITRAHDFYAEGELVHYSFFQDTLVSVRLAGLTMWPKAVFTQWLSENTDSATILSVQDT